MTLLLREVVRFTAEAGLWLLVLGLVAGAAAAAVLYAIDRRVAPRDLGTGILVGALVAALAHRLGITVWSPDVAGRSLPVVWAVVASAGAATATSVRRGRMAS